MLYNMCYMFKIMLIYIYILKNLKIFLNWRIITLKNFVLCCQTSTWISHRYTYILSFLNLLPFKIKSKVGKMALCLWNFCSRYPMNHWARGFWRVSSAVTFGCCYTGVCVCVLSSLHLSWFGRVMIGSSCGRAQLYWRTTEMA